MGAAPLGEVGEGAAEVAVEAAHLGRRQRAGRSERGQAGPPQHLVGDQVADAGHPGLVEQPGLQRGRRPGQGPAQAGGAERRRRRARGGTTSGSRVTPPSRRGSWTTSRPPSAKVTDHRSHAGSYRVGGVEEPADGVVAVDEQRSRHPEPHADHRAVVDVEQEELADPAGPGEPPADQGRGQRRRRCGALQEPRVGRVDRRRSLAVERAFGQGPVALHLDQFGHAPRVPSRPARTGPDRSGSGR